MKLEFYQLDKVDHKQIEFAVISAIYKGKWVYVRHKVAFIKSCEAVI